MEQDRFQLSAILSSSNFFKDEFLTDESGSLERFCFSIMFSGFSKFKNFLILS